MNIEKTLDSIPIDLFLEIFSRLPAKSVGRCRCVSKQWASILVSQNFTELFLTRSSTRPRLLLAVEGYNNDGWGFYSLPQHQNPLKKSVVVAADFHTKFPTSRYNIIYASGLFFSPEMRISKRKGDDPVLVIGNPITGQYAILPKLRMVGKPSRFFGFDPIDKQFKVLLMNYNKTVHHILTLGAGIMRWRKIQCPFTHVISWHNKEICINGVLYYKAYLRHEKSCVIVCFDVRSEKFKLIEAKYFSHQLVNYKGKLGAIKIKYNDYDGCPSRLRTRELRMWVLEDVDKQEWSKYVYPFSENENYKCHSVVGVTATGEIVFSEYSTSKSHIFYFSPERNTFHSVNFKGVGADYGRVCAFVDHVENLSVNDAKQLDSSIYDLRSLVSFESINKFDDLCRLDDD